MKAAAYHRNGPPEVLEYQDVPDPVVAVPAITTWKIPDGADVAACACVPIAFGTAHDCLFEFGHLVEGETVLVQAGAGGVGMAAIQLAKRAGATVIATASSLDGWSRWPTSASTTRSTTRRTAGSTRCGR